MYEIVIRRQRSHPTTWLVLEEDDRLVAEQLGEMLCPDVAKLAQEKTFAGSEGVVIQ